MFPIWKSLKFGPLANFGVKYILMGESNASVSAYTTYRHLQLYSSHLSICKRCGKKEKLLITCQSIFKNSLLKDKIPLACYL